MNSEVELRCATSITSEQTNVIDTRLGQINVPNAGAIHNPTIEKQAKELEENNGKRRFRSICGTFWCDNYELRQQHFDFVREVWIKELKFICYGAIERTEENKKPHCHFLIMFDGQKQWKTIIKTLDPHLYHIEAARKVNAAYSYCRKEDPNNLLEWGEQPKQGARTDLKKMLEECNYKIEKIRDEHTNEFIRYRNGLKEICEKQKEKEDYAEWCNWKYNEEKKRYVEKKEYNPPKVYWFFGDSGTGKTLAAKRLQLELQDAEDINWDINRITRISGFENNFALGKIADETDILFLDEFRGDWMKYYKLLALIDGDYVNKKGTQVYIKAKYIIITSALTPEECYPNRARHDKIYQLMRRITKVICTGRKEVCDEFDEGFL